MNLLQIARKSLEASFNKKVLEIPKEFKKKYSKKQACFVTITEHNNLRGCIGSLRAHQPLYKDVHENALNAAFRDPRFPPLSKDELKNIKIEISILSIPKKLNFVDESDLLNKIQKNYGIILRKGYYSATFLPQVWEEISDKVKFLEYLSMKAGLDKDSWKNAEIWYYTVEAIKEQ